jgi:hypothetical protein
MLRSICFALALVLPLGLLAHAQEKQDKQDKQEKKDAEPAAKTYVPGIEQFMNVIQTEHAKLWFAGSARNWELAAYQLGEIKEIMSDVEDLYPKFKDLPLGKMLDDVITGPIAETEKALDAKDFAKFSAGYGKLTDACNTCHQATGNGFIVIQRPSGQAFPNQDFRPRK